MSSEELRELHEHAEHAKHNPTMVPVSLTMAILAVVVATISLLGHRAHTEEVIEQELASDSWAHYQAKVIRRHIDQEFVDLTSLMTFEQGKRAAVAEKQRDYGNEANQYEQNRKDLEREAKEYEAKQHEASHLADRYDWSEVVVEIALVVTSITLLSGISGFWYAGILLGAYGTSIASVLLPIPFK